MPSLLDGMNEALTNPVYDSMMESQLDADLEAELAMEQAADKFVDLSPEDIDAILDDENPDNIAADIDPKSESSEGETDSDMNTGILESLIKM